MVFDCETLIRFPRIFSSRMSKIFKITEDHKRNHHVSFYLVPENQIVILKKYDSKGTDLFDWQYSMCRSNKSSLPKEFRHIQQKDFSSFIFLKSGMKATEIYYSLDIRFVSTLWKSTEDQDIFCILFINSQRKDSLLPVFISKNINTWNPRI